jgi:hypothetical protein
VKLAPITVHVVELLEAIREQDETTLALRVAKIAHDDAREAIP